MEQTSLDLPVTQQPKPLVRFDNAINRAVLNYSVMEMRVVLLAMSKIPPLQKVKEDEVYYVHAGELLNFGVDPNACFRFLKSVAQTLRTKPILMRQADLAAKGIYLKGAKRDDLFEFSLLDACTYQRGEGRVGLVFHRFAIPFLTELRQRFTQFPIAHLAGINSTYGIRLYGLLEQFEGTGLWVVDLKTFRDVMGIDPAQYKLYGHLKQRVIQQAVDEINNAPNPKFFISEVEEFKVGRKVVRLAFHFKKVQPDQPN